MNRTVAPRPMTGAQPFQRDRRICVEKRDANGKLDFSEPQPPMKTCGFCGGGHFIDTMDELYALYFRDTPSAQSASWEDLKTWLDARGWTVRARTW